MTHPNKLDAYRMRGIIDAATHAVLPLACHTTGTGVRERAAMQVEIADRIQAHLAAPQVALADPDDCALLSDLKAEAGR